MKIAIATPFYPPETEEMAVYIKELAERLAERHDVTIVAYARLPEESPRVRIFAVSKRLPLPIRLVLYMIFLFRAVRKADVLYAENGASVELPAGIVAALTRRPLFIHVGDKSATARAPMNFFLRHIERFAKKRARTVITDTPMKRPEILPFEPPPIEKEKSYCHSWDAHIKKLIDIFTHA